LGSVTAISNAGVLSAGTITWPTVAGPILAGTSTIRTFQATVTSCANFITNIGYATVYGINNISSQVVVTCNTVTPVELIDFTVSSFNHNALLNWTTASEINNDHFEIERSMDGIHFQKIGSVSGKGNTNSVSYYSLKDENIPEAKIYYRLIQVDLDGTTKISKTVVLDLSEKEKIVVYPNPFTREITLLLQSDEKEYKAVIVNLVGQEVMNLENLTSGKMYLIGEELPQGVYVLKITTKYGTKVLKINKE
jgi:hypothetical protein